MGALKRIAAALVFYAVLMLDVGSIQQLWSEPTVFDFLIGLGLVVGEVGLTGYGMWETWVKFRSPRTQLPAADLLVLERPEHVPPSKTR